MSVAASYGIEELASNEIVELATSDLFGLAITCFICCAMHMNKDHMNALVFSFLLFLDDYNKNLRPFTSDLLHILRTLIHVKQGGIGNHIKSVRH